MNLNELYDKECNGTLTREECKEYRHVNVLEYLSGNYLNKEVPHN